MSEVRAAATPDLDALALLAGKDAEAVVLHLMQPARSCGRIRNEGRIAGPDETGWLRRDGEEERHNMFFM